MIELKTPDEIDAMRAAGIVVADALSAVKAEAQAGVSLAALDQVARDVLADAGASSPFLGYRPGFARAPFPGVICTSVNDAVLRGGEGGGGWEMGGGGHASGGGGRGGVPLQRAVMDRAVVPGRGARPIPRRPGRLDAAQRRRLTRRTRRAHGRDHPRRPAHPHHAARRLTAFRQVGPPHWATRGGRSWQRGGRGRRASGRAGRSAASR